VVIHNDKYNNQLVPKPLVLLKRFEKSKTNARRVHVLIFLTSSIDLSVVLLVVGAMDMVTPHSGIKENYILTASPWTWPTIKKSQWPQNHGCMHPYPGPIFG
jgi:hypothetical protein